MDSIKELETKTIMPGNMFSWKITDLVDKDNCADISYLDFSKKCVSKSNAILILKNLHYMEIIGHTLNGLRWIKIKS